jgi:rubrerythrin
MKSDPRRVETYAVAGLVAAERAMRDKGVGVELPPAFRREVVFDLRCSSCGYGVAVRIAPDGCPMCRGSVWEHAPQRRNAALRVV